LGISGHSNRAFIQVSPMKKLDALHTSHKA
jgi:hypothetical protein